MAVLPSCIDILNSVLGGFLNIPKPLKSHLNNNFYTLRNYSSSLVTKDEKGEFYTIYPFPIQESLIKFSDFYFSFSCTLAQNDEIESIGIRILLRDPISTPEDHTPTEILMRIEWSNKSSDKNAQPHWHVHPYKTYDSKLMGLKPDFRKVMNELIEEEKAKAQSFKDIETSDSQSAKTHQSMLYFHLPMLAEWDKNTTLSNKKILGNKSLSTWLSQCLIYTKSELEYILQKTS